ncbi:MAG: DUF1284 domain-containing protein [Firmicutes bacterium]|nr:DUF1284 domain-containing protein [Bacillota bacterium]
MTPSNTPSFPTPNSGVSLRGHHLLCLLGYRGMGYSDAYVANMTSIYETLRLHPETLVHVVAGPDELCAAFPDDQPNHCREETVYTRDDAILRALGLSPTATLPWSEVEARVHAHIAGADLIDFCQTCPWRPYGVCEAGIEHIRAGGRLRALPDSP